MHKNLPAEPLSSRFQNTIDEVVRALRLEAGEHGTEAWNAVCQRVGAQVGIWVSMSERYGFWEPPKLLENRNNLHLQPRSPHGSTHIRNALSDHFVVVVMSEPNQWAYWFRIHDWKVGGGANMCDPNPADANANQAPAPGQDELTPAAARDDDSGSSHQNQPALKSDPSSTAAPAHRSSQASAALPEYSNPCLIREFDRREQERGPIFAGFIVKDLLPRMGFDPTEAKRILRAMEAHDIVRTERKRNPKNPERDTTFVTLNREHPQVVRVLTGSNAVQRTFPIASIDGEQLSETIIRERR